MLISKWKLLLVILFFMSPFVAGVMLLFWAGKRSSPIADDLIVGTWQSDAGVRLEFTDAGTVRCVESNGYTVAYSGQYKVVNHIRLEITNGQRNEVLEFHVTANELRLRNTFTIGEDVGTTVFHRRY